MKEYSAAEMEAMGPLLVSAANPCYFAVANGKDTGNGTGKGTGGKAVYLTGSHIWNNFQDRDFCTPFGEGGPAVLYLTTG